MSNLNDIIFSFLIVFFFCESFDQITKREVSLFFRKKYQVIKLLFTDVVKVTGSSAEFIEKKQTSRVVTTKFESFLSLRKNIKKMETTYPAYRKKHSEFCNISSWEKHKWNGHTGNYSHNSYADSVVLELNSLLEFVCLKTKGVVLFALYSG